MGYWNPKGDEEMMVNIFKVGIRDIHRETDKIFIDEFLRGGISRMTYANFLAQLYHVYEAMEEEMARHQDHSVVGPVYFPTQLTRLPNLQRDLEFLYGEENWSNRVQVLPTTKQYVERIREIGDRTPALLMAHAFTRYMGDLFGGQILRRKWSRVFQFKQDEGVLFYTFSNIDNVSKFREYFEMRVNSLDLDLKEKYQQLEEMKLVFKFNTDLVLEILKVARSTPGGFLENANPKKQTWEEEIKELSKGENLGGCVFSSKSKGKCPVDHNKESAGCPVSTLRNIPLTTYGLMACATLVLVYPLARKVLH